MRFFLGLGAKTKRFFLSSSAKEKAVVMNEENQVGDFDYRRKPIMASGIGYSEFGSKDEIFFDSKAWIDSDCEDDFLSVNGDFTPSRGSTPNYQFTPRRSQLDKSSYLPTSPQTKSEPSPTDGKKKLFDLLQESFEGEHADDEQNTDITRTPDGYKVNINQTSRSSEESPYLSSAHSGCSSEMTPSRKDRRGRAKQCCFPALVPNCSSSDRKKQKMSPMR